MPSPCIKVCVMEGDICKACRRTKEQIEAWDSFSPQQEQIEAWDSFSPQQQLKIMKELRDEQYKTKQ